MVVNLARIWRHLVHTPATLRRCLPEAALTRIESAVHAAEKRHGGELRIAIEGDLSLGELRHDTTPRERAVEVFAQLGVWDTPLNNGVLLYILLADRDVEILADRGFNGLVESSEWETVCVAMESEFALGHWEAGLVQGIEAASDLIAMYFPPLESDSEGLPDRPELL